MQCDFFKLFKTASKHHTNVQTMWQVANVGRRASRRAAQGTGRQAPGLEGREHTGGQDHSWVHRAHSAGAVLGVTLQTGLH